MLKSKLPPLNFLEFIPMMSSITMWWVALANHHHHHHHPDSSQMDTLEDANSPGNFLQEFNMTDYNPEDIDHINVNELLSQYHKNTNMN